MLLIGNEAELVSDKENGKEENDIYMREKEKIIGRTIIYQPNIAEKINSLLDGKRYKNIKIYSGLIANIMQRWECQNLRYVEFACMIFNIIYNKGNNKLWPKGKYSKEILRNIFKSVLNISIAYKEGMPRRNTTKEIKRDFVWQNYYQKNSGQAGGQREFFWAFSFVEDYIYDSYASLDAIKRGVELFEKWLENRNLRNDPINRYLQLEELEDNQIDGYISELMENLKNGKYSLDDYPNILFVLQKLNDIGFKVITPSQLKQIMVENIQENKIGKALVSNWALVDFRELEEDYAYVWSEIRNLVNLDKQDIAVNINELLINDQPVCKVIKEINRQNGLAGNKLFSYF